MKVITLARKPLTTVAGNVLNYGTGGLDIDNVRVGTEVITTHSRGKNTAFPKRPTENSVEQSGRKVRQDVHLGGPRCGRWPSNIILQHHSVCQIVGERSVKTGTAVQRNRDGGVHNQIYGAYRKPPGEDATYGVDGKENIPLWSCSEECGVRDLDMQSGVLTSGSGTVKRASAGDRSGNRSSAYGTESRKAGDPQVWYGDSGAASRFFFVLG